MIDIDVRDPDVPLSEVGRRQAAAVDRRRKDAPLELRPTLLAPHFDVTLSDLRHSQGSPLVQCAIAVGFRPGEATRTALSASQERPRAHLPRHRATRGLLSSARLSRTRPSHSSTELATPVASLPFERAYATARLALAEAGLDFAIQRDERVRERDLGLVDGLTGVSIRKRYSDEAARHAKLGKFYYRPPRGESWVNVATCAGCSPCWSARSAFSRDKSRPSWPPHCVRSANRG